MGRRPRSTSQRPDRSVLAWSLAAALATGAPAASASAADALPPAGPVAAPRVQSLFLDLVLDGRVVRPLVAVELETGVAPRVPVEDLVAIGLRLPATAAPAADGRIALDAFEGLDYRYDAAQQQLALFPAAGQRVPVQLGYRTPAAFAVDRDPGFVLDWDSYGRHTDGEGSLALGTRLRWFGGHGAFEFSGVSRAGDRADAYDRLETRWSYSDPARLWTWTAGDLVTSGLGWTRPVRLGGVQWRRDFSIRPDLIVFPMPQFAASAAVPSSVELYVNNLRQYGVEVEPGPFVLSDFPRVLGAGEAVVVVTDALGRKSETRVPLYVDYQRLARGLTDFSVEAGLLRTGFGSGNDRYSDRPVASASLRHGLHDHLTAEAHVETGEGLRLGGGGLAWSPGGRFGIATLSWAHSGGLQRGDQYGVGYQYFARRVGFDLHHQRASAGYRDLASLGGDGATLRAQDRASGWVNLPHGGLTATWLRYRDSVGLESRSVSLGATYTRGQASASLNLFDDRLAGRGVSLSVSVAFGARGFVSASASRREGRNDIALGVRQSAPYAGGWGWEAQVRDEGRGQVSSHYRGATGDWVLGLDRTGGEAGTGAFAQAAGSVALMDGRVFASRRIHDAFALVSTNGVADVPVLYENRVAGVTDADGYLLLPELRGWQRNRIAIDPDALPPDIALAATERLVTPADRAGVRASFELRPLRSASLRLHTTAGEPVAAGTRVARADGRSAIVGYDGVLWLEDYRDGELLRWGPRCTATAPALPPASATTDRPVLTCNEDTR